MINILNTIIIIIIEFDIETSISTVFKITLLKYTPAQP